MGECKPRVLVTAMARICLSSSKLKFLVQATVTNLAHLSETGCKWMVKLGGVCAGDAVEQNQIMLWPCYRCCTWEDRGPMSMFPESNLQLTKCWMRDERVIHLIKIMCLLLITHSIQDQSSRRSLTPFVVVVVLRERDHIVGLVLCGATDYTM